MKKVLKQASSLMESSEEHIRKYIHHQDSAVSFYRNSIHKVGKAVIAMARDHKSRFLMVLSSNNAGTITKFSGEKVDGGSIVAKKCPLNERNAGIIRELFPWTAPICPSNKKTIIGCGDRLGVATPGHIAAVKDYHVFPVLIQNSIKQLKLVQRTFKEVVDDTSFLVFQSGYKDGFGADGNQLKTIADINIALAAGIPMITLDLEEVFNAKAKTYTKTEVNAAYEKLPQKIKKRVSDVYINQEFTIANGIIKFNDTMAKRCAVMYYKALNFIEKAFHHIKKNTNDYFNLEVALNDKATPTLLEEHLFIINELSYRGVKLSSLAPKFVGDFKRGLDYVGDINDFSDNFASHCNIAKSFGDYIISIHTGSDKYSIYPEIGTLSKKRFHLKTAGTSWLEALRIIAEKTPVLYRIIHQCAMDNVNDSLKYYDEDVKPNLIPDIEDCYDEDLPAYLDDDNARQLLHISYGAILNNKTIRPMLFSIMHKHSDDYHDNLEDLFIKHLKCLKVTKEKKPKTKR